MDFGLSGIFENLSYFINQFANQDPVSIAMYFFWHGLWVIFLAFFIYQIYEVWLDGRQGIYASKWEFVLLAIDIPKNNEQTPKAVENIFQTIAGAHVNFNLLDIYWTGKILDSFSFEIVTIEGYIQFLIRTQKKYRDMIEASVYAQYPDAEITEVEDYTQDYAKMKFPNSEYDLWGSEFVLVKDYPFPIKTYKEFEHGLTQEFMDPMASLLENLGRFGPGEQGWMQIVITPRAAGWGETAKKVIKQLAGQSYTPPQSITDNILSLPGGFFDGLLKAVFSLFGSGEAAPVKKEENLFKVMNLTPGEKTVLEKVQEKLAKSNFGFKWRYIYLAKKEVFNKNRGVSGIAGSIKQFNSLNCNALKPGGGFSKTSVDYTRVPQRVAQKQNRIMYLYCMRHPVYGDDPTNHVFNEEELATVWHFPMMSVKAATLERTETKKSAPPTRLPYQSVFKKNIPTPVEPEISPQLGYQPITEKKKAAPPPNLPVV